MSKVTKSNIYAVLGGYGVSNARVYAVLNPYGVSKSNIYTVLGPADKGISKALVYAVLDEFIYDAKDLWVDDNDRQYVDNDNLQWFSGYYDVNVHIDDDFYYSGIGSILYIYDLETRLLVKSLSCSGIISYVWSNSNYIFITTDIGVLYVDKSTIDVLSVYKQYPDITNDIVNDIDGDDVCLLFATNSGIDFFDTSSGDHCYMPGIYANKCCFLNRRSIFYSDSVSIYRSNPSSELLSSDLLFTAGSGILNGSEIIDFKVNNYGYYILTDLSLYAVSSSGYKVIDYDDMFKFDIDSDTRKDSGKIYITTKYAYMVVNMTDDSIYDMYRFDFAGRSGQTLNYLEIKGSDKC